MGKDSQERLDWQRRWRHVDWFTTAGLALVSVFLVMSVVCMVVLACSRGGRGSGVSTEWRGDYEIIEVETRGERHEYLYYRDIHRGSVCHLPNCKYCRERGAKEPFRSWSPDIDWMKEKEKYHTVDWPKDKEKLYIKVR